MAQTRAVGATAHRFLVDWRVVEPEAPKDPEHHTYDFTQFDVMYRADVRAGIAPLITIMNAPDWASAEGTTPDARANNPPGADHLEDWAAFAGAVAERYPRALGIEIWNEPNLAIFWGSGNVGPNPEAYTSVLAAASKAINHVNGSIPVIGGALGGATETTGSGIAAGEFAKGMFDAGGAQYIDAISVHPYPGGGGFENFESDLEAVRHARDVAGSEAPIWITEVGVSTSGPDAVTADQQATALTQIFHSAFAASDVGVVFVHNLFPTTIDLAGGESGFALLTATGEPTPAFTALRDAQRLRLAGSNERP